MPTTTRRRDAREESGATLVEFALVAPIVLSTILAVIQYGFLFWSLETAEAAAREAARRAAVGAQWTCTRDEAVRKVGAAALGSVSVTPASDPLTTGARGRVITVQVSFPSLDMHLPFAPVPDGGKVTGTAQARVENVPETAAARAGLCPS